ncbi:MAG: hypothetical protein H0X66_19230 [Verrucomicrobia bacterium]|nr:hypothetical protein [Verrucomicrobiota bacterium]
MGEISVGCEVRRNRDAVRRFYSSVLCEAAAKACYYRACPQNALVKVGGCFANGKNRQNPQIKGIWLKSVSYDFHGNETEGLIMAAHQAAPVCHLVKE